MSDIRIELTQVLHGNGDNAHASGQHPATYTKKYHASKSFPGIRIQANKTNAPSGRFDVRHSLYTMVAEQVRSFDRAMNTTSDYIEKIKERLKMLVKCYPPYPPGSEEMVHLLRSFQAFRRQIDQLTVPGPQKTNNIEVPGGHSVVSLADYQAFIEHNIKKLGILRQKIKGVIECLSVPELPEAAGNSAIYAALKHLGHASEDMIELKNELKQGASEIFTSLEGFEGIQSPGGVCAPQGVSEAKAESKSVEIKMTLFHKIKTGLTLNPGQLSELCI